MLEPTKIDRETDQKMEKSLCIAEDNETIGAMDWMNMEYNHILQKSVFFHLLGIIVEKMKIL